jgi:hypothetical protein
MLHKEFSWQVLANSVAEADKSSPPGNLKGLSHEMDAWSVIGLNIGTRPVFKFLGAPLILKRKKCISCDG